MYFENEGSEFRLERCYAILMKCAKWVNMVSCPGSSKKKRKRSDNVKPEDVDVGHLSSLFSEENSNISDFSGDKVYENVDIKQRPKGIKAAKKDLAQFHARRTIARQTSRLVSVQEERNRLLKLAHESEKQRIAIELFSKNLNEVR